MLVGNVDIQVVNDGVMHLDGGTMFGVIPRTIWSTHYPPDEQNRIPIAINNAFFTSEGRLILVDAGLGSRLTPKQTALWGLVRDGDLIANLSKLGVTPEDIDIVIMTHLHPDHAAGSTRLVDGKLAPVFPKAQFWVQRKEWEAATNPNDWSRFQYEPQNFLPIAEAGQLHLIDGDTPVTSEIRCVLAEGHTPGHQCVVVESAGEWAAIMGDVAPMMPHVERPQWLPAFDMEPMVNLETKKRFYREAREKNGIFFLAHDPNVVACRLVEQDGRVRAKAVM
ncbi:MAG: MBL fold metallo-hydrolase [Dehalococcoidia bacterium]|nr:MBL fold metallo-hydrolase [Dehalococcoidia bacterium]